MADLCHNTPGMSGQSPMFPLEKLIKTDEPEQWCYSLSYFVESMIITTRLALENDGAGIVTDDARVHAAANTLEVAQALLAVINEGTEALQRKAGIGLFTGRADA